MADTRDFGGARPSPGPEAGPTATTLGDVVGSGHPQY